MNEMVWYEWGLFPRRRSGYLQYFFLSYYSLKVVKHQIWTVLAHYPTAPTIVCFYKNPAVLWVNWFGTSKGLLVAEDQDTCNISLWVITVWKSWNVKFELFWRSTLPPHNFFVFFNNLLVLWVNWLVRRRATCMWKIRIAAMLVFSRHINYSLLVERTNNLWLLLVY